MKRQFNQLPQVAFSILLALSLKPRHGYEIIKQVEEDSAGKIKLVSGALYTSIKKLHEQGLIEEVTETGDTRRYYKLTKAGTTALADELSYYQATVELGRKRQILTMQVA
ncbi:MAG TPA: PadR family transcriptional regulator [Candidatus Saccharimonadales bacterium]|nr:PadR family transcriptional regulator [Candidatus Saccharimonadales bacterium]